MGSAGSHARGHAAARLHGGLGSVRVGGLGLGLCLGGVLGGVIVGRFLAVAVGGGLGGAGLGVGRFLAVAVGGGLGGTGGGVGGCRLLPVGVGRRVGGTGRRCGLGLGAVLMASGGLAVTAVDVRRRAEHGGDGDGTDGHGRQRHGQPAKHGHRRGAPQGQQRADHGDRAERGAHGVGELRRLRLLEPTDPRDAGDPRRHPRGHGAGVHQRGAGGDEPPLPAQQQCQPGAQLQDSDGDEQARQGGVLGVDAGGGGVHCTGSDRGQPAHVRRADPSGDPLVHQCDSLHSRHRQERSTPEM